MKSWSVSQSLEDRVVKTLEIANRWGYGLAEDELSDLLYGGPEDTPDVQAAAAGSPSIVLDAGFAALSGQADLIAKSLARRRSNGTLVEAYFRIAEDFTRDLLRHCPFVRAVVVCGSTASGGLEAGDDVDFNLFAEDGTKYIVYLTALLLGVKYSLLHHRAFANGDSLLRFLRKVTCVNVVWTESDCHPFIRQDELLAFELLRSLPIAGTAHYARTLESNRWLRLHFPQIFNRVFADRVQPQEPSSLAALQRWIARAPRGRRFLDGMSRRIAAVLHRIVRLSRERNPDAMARYAFLRHVKFPYDVFQD